MSGLLEHLATGITQVCRAWMVERADGLVYGFTDHDRDLTFDGTVFKASSGMTARALQQTTGLSVDNSEAMGALSDAAITEADILAGQFDGAEVRSWLVNWQDASQRALQFRGRFGDIVRSGGAFRAELRGLSEALNRVQGRVYHRACGAVLGDADCAFDLNFPGIATEQGVVAASGTEVRVAVLPGFAPRWFERGRLNVLTGAAAGTVALIKADRDVDGQRVLDLWQGLGADLAVGDLVRLEPGCDKSAATCRAKFNNFLNFRGFPHIPGEDWLASYPVATQSNDGGSLGR